MMRPSSTDARRRWLYDTLELTCWMTGMLISVARSVVNGSDGSWENWSCGTLVGDEIRSNAMTPVHGKS